MEIKWRWSGNKKEQLDMIQKELDELKPKIKKLDRKLARLWDKYKKTSDEKYGETAIIICREVYLPLKGIAYELISAQYMIEQTEDVEGDDEGDDE